MLMATRDDLLILAPRTIERRARVRQDVTLSAVIRVPSGEEIECTIKNISSMGALLIVSGPTVLPTAFTLIVPDRWFQAQCQIRHSSADRVGVEFVSNRREALGRFG